MAGIEISTAAEVGVEAGSVCREWGNGMIVNVVLDLWLWIIMDNSTHYVWITGIIMNDSPHFLLSTSKCLYSFIELLSGMILQAIYKKCTF